MIDPEETPYARSVPATTGLASLGKRPNPQENLVNSAKGSILTT
jgi:hypothetical protein